MYAVLEEKSKYLIVADHLGEQEGFKDKENLKQRLKKQTALKKTLYKKRKKRIVIPAFRIY
ncbi:hypothetical protein AL523_00745 [Enterococcus gallinarum]|jgi:hypothetical protein|uniref:hypothetical protein n=1 Tax=Enterococcus sp. AZ173 TaxID=2774700 RepID=UPI00030978A8|nr:hypothetical protein AL523_00745 [Enterococcus gallinarum]EPH61906.1 hypothetical protein D931_02089 [Enterococcus faecium 13.SD.W.09]